MKKAKILSIGFLFFAAWFYLSFYAQAQEVLTWKDCLRETSRHHPDLIVAQESVAQAQFDKKITLSGALPEFSADLSGTTAHLSMSGFGKTFAYGAQGSLLLFDGLKTVNDIHAASENIKAVRENFKFTSASVRLTLRQAFINLLKAQKLIDLTEEIYQLRKNNLELISLRYESGTEHKGALLTAKANLSQAAFEVSAAKRGLETAQKKLNKELGRERFSAFVADGGFVITDDFTTIPDFEELAQNNASLLQITAKKNAAAFAIKASRGDFLPTVVLNGSAQKTDSQWPPQDSETSAGIKVSVPIFSGGANVARLSKAQSVYRQWEQEERNQKDEVRYGLEKSWNDFVDASQKVKVQQDFLAASEERVKIAQAQYSVGLITFDNWTIIEDDLVGARKVFLDVQTAALLAQASWVQAQGGTLEYEN